VALGTTSPGSGGRQALFVLLFFAAATFVLTLPIALHPDSSALALSADTRLFLWTLSWDAHALLTNPTHLFDANIFFPERHTLAYSEHLFGSALLVAPLLALGKPLLALNTVVLLSCFLSGLGAFVLAREAGASAGGALVAGVVYAFAPPRFFRLGQIHLATVEWIPFCLASIHAFLREGKARHALLAALFFTIQCWTSGHGGLFLLLAGTGLLAYSWATGGLARVPPLLPGLGAAAVLALLANLPFLLPYFEVRREQGLRRTLGAVEEWTPNLVSYLAAPTYLELALLGRARIDEAKAFLFPGLVTLVLAGCALGTRRETSPSPPVPALRRPLLLALEAAAGGLGLLALGIAVSGGLDATILGIPLRAASPRRAAAGALAFLLLRVALGRTTPPVAGALGRALGSRFASWAGARMGVPGGFYLLLALGAFWASFGPSLGLYSALYRLVPGFDLIRVPSRLMILASLGLAVLAALGADRLASGPGRRLVPCGLAALALLEFAAPLGARPYEIPRPPIDAEVASLPADAPIVELPVADPRDPVKSARLHSTYLLHSLAHFHPMVNGYSGFVPGRHEELFRLLKDFPDEASLAALERIGVGFAVVHPELYPAEEWPRAEARLAEYAARLRPVAASGRDRIYALERSPH
jgi:hypothetical protein